MVLTNGHPRSIKNSFRVGCTNQIGASQCVQKVKPSDSAPLLAPTSPPPKTSISSSLSFDSPLSSKHSLLVTVSSSTTISTRGFGYHGGCTSNAASPMLRVSLHKRRSEIFWRKIGQSLRNDVAFA